MSDERQCHLCGEHTFAHYCPVCGHDSQGQHRSVARIERLRHNLAWIAENPRSAAAAAREALAFDDETERHQ